VKVHIEWNVMLSIFEMERQERLMWYLSRLQLASAKISLGKNGKNREIEGRGEHGILTTEKTEIDNC